MNSIVKRWNQWRKENPHELINLAGACLTGAYLNYESHELIAEILRQHAEGVWSRLALAGLVLISRDESPEWCWKDFAKLPLPKGDVQWAIDTLTPWVKADSDVPTLLCTRVAEAQAKAEAVTA